MKKVLLLTLVLLLAFASLASAAPSESEVIASFKSYVDKEVKKALVSYETDNQQLLVYKDRKPPLWQKEVYALSTDYTIDLRKNDSMIRPYIGTLEIAKITYSQTFATREAAEACDRPNYKDDQSRRYVITVAYQEGKWVVTRIYMPYYRQEKEVVSISEILKNDFINRR